MKHSHNNGMTRRWIAMVMLMMTILCGRIIANDEIPGADQTRPIALIHAVVYPVTSPAIENAAIVFDKGRIIAVGRDVPIPSSAEVIDLAGRHIYPGLIGGPSDLGLTEIAAVRATNDRAETGELNPNVRAELAVNPDSEHIPTTRSNGVLFSITAPQGGLISGSAVLLNSTAGPTRT